MENGSVTSSRRRGAGGRSAAVMKVMGIFSGVQAVTIICSVVRTKLVALWIGAAGVGLFGIFNSSIDMLSSLTLLGIATSSVRDIAAAEGGRKRLLGTVTRRWGMILGMAGALVMALLSPFLSRYSFGSTARAWQFALLGACLLLNAMTATNNAVLQGFKRFRNLARSTMWGAIGSVALSAPLFYLWGIDSIVPALLVFSAATFGASWLNRERLGHMTVGLRGLWSEGRAFLRLGAYMTVTGFAAYMVSYIFVSWLNTRAGTDTVGYYQSGLTLFNRYAGLIFTAITVEYYPRLSTVATRRRFMETYVNHEATLLMWALLVIVPVFVLATPLLVRILYTGAFSVIVPMVTLGIIGTVLRGISWCMSFTMLARGDGRLFLATELTSSAVCLALNIGGYTLWGLEGLGLSYTVWYGLYTVIVATVYRRVYGMRLRPRVKLHAALALGAAVAAAAIALLTPWWWLNIPLAAGCGAVGSAKLLKIYRR